MGQLGGDWNIGKTMGKPWENHGETMGINNILELDEISHSSTSGCWFGTMGF